MMIIKHRFIDHYVRRLRFCSLPRGEYWSCPQLKTLVLRHNTLVSPLAAPDLPQLTTVDFSSNLLTEIPTLWISSPHVASLNVIGNKIPSIPDGSILDRDRIICHVDCVKHDVASQCLIASTKQKGAYAIGNAL